VRVISQVRVTSQGRVTSQVRVTSKVSFETSFDSKQPKLEPKLVSAQSETKRLFRLLRFYTQTESFDVSIEPKQTEDQPKLFDRDHITYNTLICPDVLEEICEIYAENPDMKTVSKTGMVSKNVIISVWFS
jgi:hypothetical protein